MKDHKRMYGVYLRVGILSSITITILLFIFIPYAAPEPYKLNKEILTIVEEISSQIDKYEEPPKIERPKVVVPAQEGITKEDVEETMGSSDFKEDIIKTTPTGPEIEIVPYYKLEIKPQATNNPVPKYPEMARKAGLEGVTVVKMLIDIDGSVIDVQILKSSGNSLLDESAAAAARQSKFTPAKQRDRSVRVWVSRKFEFKLTGG